MVLNVWAAWCTNCTEEMPVFAAVHRGPVTGCGSSASTTTPREKYGQQSAARLRGVRSRRCTTRTATGTIKALRVAGPPQTFFVTADGEVAGRKIGAIQSQAELDRLVSDLPRGPAVMTGHSGRRANRLPEWLRPLIARRVRGQTRAAEPVPAAGRGRPRVGGADAVRSGEVERDRPLGTAPTCC